MTVHELRELLADVPDDYEVWYDDDGIPIGPNGITREDDHKRVWLS